MKKFNTPFSGGRLQQYLLVALLVMLAGCSSLRLSYNNGDTLLYWWLNAYVDLESDQKGWVQKDIDKMFHWHRQTQLKDYVQVLTNAQRQLQGNPTQADLLATYSDIKTVKSRGVCQIVLEMPIEGMAAAFDLSSGRFTRCMPGFSRCQASS